LNTKTLPNISGAKGCVLPRYATYSFVRIPLLVILLLGLTFGLSSRSLAVSLQEAVQAALLTSPDIGIVTESRRAIDQELEQAWSLFRPQVDLRTASGGQYTNSPGTRGRARDLNDGGTVRQLRYESGLTIRQMLFDGFAAASEVSRQEARVGAAARRVRETSEFTALDAAEAYLESFRQRELVGLAEENIVAHLNTLQLVTIKAEGGAASLTDVEQTQSRVSTAEDALVETRSRVRDADANYINTIGEAPIDLVRPQVPFQAVPENETAAVALALKLNPTIAVTRADLETAKADYQSTRAGFWPRVDLEVGANSNRNLAGTRGQTSDVSALVVMRYNIFNGGADTARRQQFIARIAEARQRMLQVQRATEREMRLAWNALATARERLTALRRQVQANESVLGAYQLQFDIGRRDLLDLLDAENDLYRSRTNLLTAEFVELFGVYRVLASAGVMLATLDLAPPSESLTDLEERRLLELEETLRTVPKYSEEVLDDDAPVLDPNAPLLDPNAPLLDPNAPLLDPNAPLLDPNAPLLDPEVEPESGKILPKETTDDDIAAKRSTPNRPGTDHELVVSPEVLDEAPSQDVAPTIADDPILWVKRTTPNDSANLRDVIENLPGDLPISPSVRQPAARAPAEFVEFSDTNSNKQISSTSVLTSGFVEHKLPSELLEFEVSKPPVPAVALLSNRNPGKATGQNTTSTTERTLPASETKLAEGSDQSIWLDPLDVPEVALSTPRRDDRRTIDAVVGADKLTAVEIPREKTLDARSTGTTSAPKQVSTSVAVIDNAPDAIGAAEAATQIARLEPSLTRAEIVPRSDKTATVVAKAAQAPVAPKLGAAEVSAAMEFGMSPDLPAQTTEHATTNPVVPPVPLAKAKEDSRYIDPPEMLTGAEVPAQIALLSPMQDSATGRASEQRLADDPARSIVNPSALSKAEHTPDAASISVNTPESARPVAGHNNRLVVAASPEERMPDRYASAAASSAALPPIVPYGFFDIDRPLASGQTHILLPARPTRSVANTYAGQRQTGRQLATPLLEEPIKASAVAALIPSGHSDPGSTTPRYPFWSFE
jgi:outer membrane protein, adhesin transport system